MTLFIALMLTLLTFNPALADGFSRIDKTRGIGIQTGGFLGVSPEITYNSFVSDTTQFFLSGMATKIDYNDNGAEGELGCNAIRFGYKRFFSPDNPLFLGGSIGYLSYDGELEGTGDYAGNRHDVYTYSCLFDLYTGFESDGGFYGHLSMGLVYPFISQANVAAKREAYYAGLQARYIEIDLEDKLSRGYYTVVGGIGYYF